MFAPKTPAKSADFPANLSLKIPRNLSFSSANYQKPSLEYAAQVWQDIPAYLSDAIVSIQKRALRIIFLNFSYQQALD